MGVKTKLQLIFIVVAVGSISTWWHFIGRKKFVSNKNDIDMSLFKSVKANIKTIKVNVEHIDVKVDDGKIYHVYYLESTPSTPPKAHVILLHGMAETLDGTSDLWESAGSLRLFAAAGYHVIAPDLPGPKQSRSKTDDDDELTEEAKPDFVKELMILLKIEKAIIVGASWGGTFALPLLINDSNVCFAFVAMAPVGSQDFTKGQYENTEVPTLIIYGEDDKTLGEESYRNLKNLPKSKQIVVPGVGHELIKEDSDSFNAGCLNFMEGLFKKS